ncbi:hypothetical protein SAMN05421863_103318 [Nitrosomonas communis]|uniref:Uncharacterized protein n=1 Tax=Nitrosomonas communis TaxID=44574 RepID=A0A1I4RJ57_9PROT|nr:hypothetical protein SAMN05421863_103318 [Nitrosomonas communis]
MRGIIFRHFYHLHHLFHLVSAAYEKTQRGACGGAQNSRHFRWVCRGKAEKVVKMSECHAGQEFPHTPFFSTFFRPHPALGPAPCRCCIPARVPPSPPLPASSPLPGKNASHEGKWLASAHPPPSLVACVSLEPSDDTAAPKHPWQERLARSQQGYR